MDKRSKEYKIKQFGSEQAYSEEMKRRAAMRKTIGEGKRFNSESAKQAANKRWGKDDGDSNTN